MDDLLKGPTGHSYKVNEHTFRTASPNFYQNFEFALLRDKQRVFSEQKIDLLNVRLEVIIMVSRSLEITQLLVSFSFEESNHGIPKGYNYWASPNHGFPSGNNCLIPSRRETMEGIRAKHNNYWFPKDSNHGIPKGYNYWASPNHGRDTYYLFKARIPSIIGSQRIVIMVSLRDTIMEGIRIIFSKHNNYWALPNHD